MSTPTSLAQMWVFVVRAQIGGAAYLPQRVRAKPAASSSDAGAPPK